MWRQTHDHTNKIQNLTIDLSCCTILIIAYMFLAIPSSFDSSNNIRIDASAPAKPHKHTIYIFVSGLDEGHDWICHATLISVYWVNGIVEGFCCFRCNNSHQSCGRWTPLNAKINVFRFTIVEAREQRKLPIKIEFGRESIAITQRWGVAAATAATTIFFPRFQS